MYPNHDKVETYKLIDALLYKFICSLCNLHGDVTIFWNRSPKLAVLDFIID